MGIHTWDGYVDYESKALKSYIETIERFCSECHTNEDYNGCDNCPTGRFIEQLRNYLVDTIEIIEKYNDEKSEMDKVLIKIKKLIKKMPKLHPLYLPVSEDYEFDSVFNNLRKLCFELELRKECSKKKFEWKMHIAEIRSLGERFRKELNERQIKLIEYLKTHEFIRSETYSKMFNITDRQARSDLSKLVTLGLLLKEGKARLIKYKLYPEISGNIRK